MKRFVPISEDTHWDIELMPLVAWVVLSGVLLVMFGPWAGGIGGTVIILAYGWAARHFVAGAHERGVRLLRTGDLRGAIAAFKESLEVFKHHPRVDKYRSIALLSFASMTYAEMALLNIALAYAMLDSAILARLHYKQCLELNPQNSVALTGLQMLDAGAHEAAGGRSAS